MPQVSLQHYEDLEMWPSDDRPFCTFFEINSKAIFVMLLKKPFDS